MKLLRILALTLACILATMAYGQSMYVPPAGDPFWKTKTGIEFKDNLEKSAEVVYGKPQPVAKPSWFNRHKRILTVIAVNSAALGVNAAGLKHCRQGDVENCTAHYGAAWGTFGVQAATSTVFIILGEVSRKNGDHLFGNLFSYTPAAFNVAWGINEWRQYGPETQTRGLKINPLWINEFKKK